MSNEELVAAIQAGAEEREEKQRKERFQSEYEEIMDRAMQEAQAKVARMTPEEKRALLEKYGYA